MKCSAPCLVHDETATAVITNSRVTFLLLPQLWLLSFQWGRRAECRLEGVQVKAGSYTALAFVAFEAGQVGAPESPGHFPRQGAQAAGASASLLPICTMLAPRIPGSSTQVACWLSPRGARGRVLAARAVPNSSCFSMCLLGCKVLFRWANASPIPTPYCMAEAQPDVLSCRAKAVPQPKEDAE